MSNTVALGYFDIVQRAFDQLDWGTNAVVVRSATEELRTVAPNHALISLLQDKERQLTTSEMRLKQMRKPRPEAQSSVVVPIPARHP